MDFDDDVLYCYEIQLEESCRGKGLGKFMMKVHNNIKYWISYCWRIMTQVLELLTIKAGLLKTMLTVFKHNTKAVTFFKEASSHNSQKDVLIQHVAVFQGLKYSLDETSPVDTIQVKPILTIKDL